MSAGGEAEAAALMAALQADPDQPAAAYRDLALVLYRLGRHGEGDAWTAQALARHPDDQTLWNLRGVMLRALGRLREALAALDRAAAIDPQEPAVQINRGNVLLGLGEAALAEPVFGALAAAQPGVVQFKRQLARARFGQGKLEAAIDALQAASLLPDAGPELWADLARMLTLVGRPAQAEGAADAAIARLGEDPRLLDAKAFAIRLQQQPGRAEAFLTALLPRFEDAAWLHYQLGSVVRDRDPERGYGHLRRAVALAPERPGYLLALSEALLRDTRGDEGANLEEAYAAARRAAAMGGANPSRTKTLYEVFAQLCAFDDLADLEDFTTRGRRWAEADEHGGLLHQLPRTDSPERRQELLEQHRIWGSLVEARAREHPIHHPEPRAPDGRIRLGFMSSDLRHHPVSYFASPLIEHPDPRFDLYGYSFFEGLEDRVQAQIAGRMAGFRWLRDTRDQDAAQLIANDQLDMLIELGGSTHMNRLTVMAYRPAPRQASWLGYPHSAGLSTIDYLICDPYAAPPDRSLLLEQPLMMPHTWLALGRGVFTDAQVITEGLPETRNGCLTFGTANNPHKYGPEVLGLWARITAAVPGARFMIVRPEGGSPTFRRNILAAFAAAGVDESRVNFRPIRGQHMPLYNEIDIALDTFPLTGGTTTAESVWMGVPVVSLRGEGFHERLSWSILSNAGLGDLVSSNLDDYFATALQLVADRPRREELRRTLRERIKQSPLGQTEAFARDFYDMVARAVAQPLKA